MYITEARADLELRNMAPTYLAKVLEYATELDVDVAVTDELIALIGTFDTDLDNVQAAKQTLSAQVVAKNDSKGALQEFISTYAKIWRANPNISDEILTDLALPPHETPGTTTPPVTPENLTYQVTAQGTATIRFDRMTNSRMTVFNLEISEGGAGNWSVVKSSTSTRFTFPTNPGQEIWFRVTATKGGITSVPSTPVVVWPAEGSETLSIAA